MATNRKMFMEKKRIIRSLICFVGIFMLLSLYVFTFVAALNADTTANSLFVLSLVLTAFIPTAIYVLIWLFKLK